MNIYEALIKYDIATIHIKDNAGAGTMSWIPVTSTKLSNEAWEDINEGICELLSDEAFTEGEYDYIAGYLTVEDDKVVLTGFQTRDVRLTQTFKTPVPA